MPVPRRIVSAFALSARVDEAERKFLWSVAAQQTSDPTRRATLSTDAARYGKEKSEIKAQAEKLEQAAATLSNDAETVLKPHHHLSFSHDDDPDRGRTLLNHGAVAALVPAVLGFLTLSAVEGPATL